MPLIVEVEVENYKPEKPPYTEFYRILNLSSIDRLEGKVILQPSRGGVRIIVLDLRGTQQLARALRKKRDKVRIRRIEPIVKYMEKILRKLAENLGRKIVIKTRTPAKTTLQEILEIAKKINAEGIETIKTRNNLYHINYQITLTQKNLHETLKLIVYGIGKHKHQGYGTIIWKIS